MDTIRKQCGAIQMTSLAAIWVAFLLSCAIPTGLVRRRSGRNFKSIPIKYDHKRHIAVYSSILLRLYCRREHHQQKQTNVWVIALPPNKHAKTRLIGNQRILEWFIIIYNGKIRTTSLHGHHLCAGLLWSWGDEINAFQSIIEKGVIWKGYAFFLCTYPSYTAT